MRDATPDDVIEVARVHVRSWQVADRGLMSAAYLDGLRPEHRAARYTFGDTRAGQPRTVIAVTDDTTCGFATTGPPATGMPPQRVRYMRCTSIRQHGGRA